MRNDGGPAFPIASDGDVLHGATFQDGRMTGGEWKACSPGMSLRDYFAIEAAKPMITSALERGMGGGNPEKLSGVINIGIPPEAYKFADAMLLERAKS